MQLWGLNYIITYLFPIYYHVLISIFFFHIWDLYCIFSLCNWSLVASYDSATVYIFNTTRHKTDINNVCVLFMKISCFCDPFLYKHNLHAWTFLIYAHGYAYIMGVFSFEGRYCCSSLSPRECLFTCICLSACVYKQQQRQMCVEGYPQMWGLGSQRALMWHGIHFPSCRAHHNMSSPLITSPTHEHSFNYERNITSYQRGPLTTSAGNFASLIIHLGFI